MNKIQKEIQIVAITGSVRQGSYTSKALAIVVDEIRKHADISVKVIDPNDIQLPLPGKKEDASIRALNQVVSGATGVILATPEYHGSYSSVIKLVIENLGYPSVLSGKPVALLGVASGAIGAIKAIEHLASVCAHIGAVVLPGPVSVAHVEKIFDKNGKCLDPVMDKRIRSVANNLIQYIRNHICPKIALEELVRKE